MSLLLLSTATTNLRAQQRGKGHIVSVGDLPPKKETQKMVLDLLAQKAGRAILMPTNVPVNPIAGLPPDEETISTWTRRSYNRTKGEAKEMAAAIGEKLLVAQEWGAKPDLTWKRAGLALAWECAQRATLSDMPKIGLPIYHGWLLPSLDIMNDVPDLMPVLGVCPAKPQVLQEAAGTALMAGENEQVRTYLGVAIGAWELSGNKMNADRARIQLATAWCKIGQKQQAIPLLENVTTPVLLGVKKWAAQLRGNPVKGAAPAAVPKPTTKPKSAPISTPPNSKPTR